MKMVMIGVRGHYGLVYQSLPDLPEMEVAGISAGSTDDLSALRQGLRERGQAPAEFSDYRAMLDKIKPDYVCVSGPFELHAEMCLEALKRNAHVFCEKPVAITMEQLEAIKAACAAKPHLRLISMVSMRYAGNYLAAYAAVKAGKIGRVLMLDARKSYKLGNRPEYYRHFETYGGTIPWVGIHVIDMIYYFSGSGFKKIFATQTRENNLGHGDLEIAAHCQFAMQNGVLAACSVDFLRPPAAPSHGDTRLRVAGTLGVLELLEDGIHDGVRLINSDGNQVLPPLPEKKIFLDLVRGGGDDLLPRLDARATYEVTRASLLARESAETGQIITLP